MADTPVAHDPALLGEAGELGWFALFVPEEFGGGSVSGSPLRDAVIVAEERGRFVQPGPFVATNVVAAAIARDGSREQQEAFLPQLATAELTASWAISDRSGTPEAGAVTGAPGGRRIRPRRHRGPRAGGRGGRVFLVTAADATGDGVTQCLVPADTPGVTVVPLDGLDLTRRFADVRFDAAKSPRRRCSARRVARPRRSTHNSTSRSRSRWPSRSGRCAG